MSELQSVLVRLCGATLKLAARPNVDQDLIDRIISLSDPPEYSRVNNNSNSNSSSNKNLSRQHKQNCQSHPNPSLQESQSFIVHLCSAALRATTQPRVSQDLINEIISLSNEYPGDNSRRREFHATSSGSQSSNEQDMNASSGSRVYAHESTAEFPNGDVEYSRPADKSKTSGVGWAMLVYGHNNSLSRQTYNKSCLGVYQCPNCSYVEKPRIPRSGKISKHARPMPAKDVCKIDGAKLVHVPCKAMLKVVHESGFIHFTHRGVHNHAKPRVTQSKTRSAQVTRPIRRSKS